MRGCLHIGTLLALFILVAGSAAGQNIDVNRIRAEDEFRWGVRAFHNGYFNEAIVAFKKALSHKPDEPLARTWLGRAYYQSGFNDAAIAEWRNVMAAGKASQLLETLTDVLDSRRGIAKELRPQERWVVSGEISGGSGEDVLFKRPAAVRARRDGSFFLVGFMSNELLVLDSNGALKRTMKGGLQGFDHPFDVVEAPDGSLYVSEFKGDRIAKCDRDGSRTGTIGSKGRAPGQLLGPQYLALDNDGSLYVTDYGNRRAAKYDRDGQFLFVFGTESDSYPGFRSPTGILSHNGNVYVADSERKHLAVFDSNGNHLKTLLEGRLAAPEGITLYREGVFLISDSKRLYFYDVERDSLTLASDFGSLAKRVLMADIDANGNILAPDFDGGKVHLLTEISGMYAGLTVMVTRISAQEHPVVTADVQVTNRFGDPVVGLDSSNFVISENRVKVAQPELLFSGSRSERFDLALVVGRSPELRDRVDLVGRIARELGETTTGFADVSVISAGTVPTVVSKPGETPIVMAKAAGDRPEAYVKNWAFDLGIRLGTTELIGKRNRKALLFLSSGILGDRAFRNYGLLETFQYMKNNSVVFYAVVLDSAPYSKELDFLARETGGKVYRYFEAKALTALGDDLRAQKDGSYLLRYRSANDTDFGRRYIPMEVEATLVRRSGRDEAGYFGPIKF